MTKVLLINPNPTRETIEPFIDERIRKYHSVKEGIGTEDGDQRHEPNNGLLSIGSTLLKKGFDVQYLDLNAIEINNFKKKRKYLTQEQIKSIVEKKVNHVDFILISALTPTINNALNISKILKEMNADFKIIIGGILPTLKPNYCLDQSNDFDALVIGEGELIVPKIIEAYLTNNFSELDREIGIIYKKHKHSNYIYKKGQNVIPDLNCIEDPAFELLEEESKPFVYRIFTARGCSSACAFCAPSYVAGHKVRNISPKKVLNQINKIKNKFNADCYVLGDLTFLDNQEHGRKILELIKENEVNLPFWCQTRFDRINENNIKLLAEAGCSQIAIGIESYNDSILNMINKGIHVNEMVRKLLLIKEYGIEVQAYFIVGLPNETKENIERTIKFAEYAVKKNFLDITHISIYVPYPGLPVMKGTKIIDKEYNHYYQGVFEDMPPYPVYKSKNLSCEDILKQYLNLLERVTYSYQNKENIYTELKNNSNLEKELVLGTEALTIASEMEEYKTINLNKKTVFNLVQGTRKEKESFISKIIHEDNHYIIGDSEVYNLNDLKSIIKSIDGIVDYILLDSDIKRKDSRRFIKYAYENTKCSKIYTYSDMAIWCRAVFILMQYKFPNIEDSNVSLFPDNEFSEYLKFLLIKRGAEVNYLNLNNKNYTDNNIDILVNFSFGESILHKDSIETLREDVVIIDATTKGIEEEAYNLLKNRNYSIFRPEMRPLLSSQMFLLENYNQYLENNIGRLIHNGITYISGGIIGNRGDIVVDSVYNPTKIIGIADGMGSILKMEQMSDFDYKKIKKAQHILIY